MSKSDFNTYEIIDSTGNILSKDFEITASGIPISSKYNNFDSMHVLSLCAFDFFSKGFRPLIASIHSDEKADIESVLVTYKLKKDLEATEKIIEISGNHLTQFFIHDNYGCMTNVHHHHSCESNVWTFNNGIQ